MVRARRRWVNRLIVLLVIVVPIVVFFVLQAVAVWTRSGSVDEVWFVDSSAGPRLVARDQIVVGVEASAQRRFRLALVDARSGERLAREKMDVALELAGTTPDTLWFQQKHGQGGLHARSPQTLERLDVPTSAAPPPRSYTADPLTDEVVLPQGDRFRAVRSASGAIEDAGVAATDDVDATANALDPALFTEPGIVVDQPTGKPLLLENPVSFLVSHRLPSEPRGALRLSRVDASGKPLWTATLERQRALRAAHEVEGQVVLVSAGPARDFAIALDAQSGQTRWVHSF